MKTREEEITQAAINEYGGLAIKHFAFEKGAQWADAHPQNPWRDAKKDPPKDMKSVIGCIYGIVAQYDYSPEEKIWSLGMLISDAPDYWMPVPELPS